MSGRSKWVLAAALAFLSIEAADAQEWAGWEFREASNAFSDAASWSVSNVETNAISPAQVALICHESGPVGLVFDDGEIPIPRTPRVQFRIDHNDAFSGSSVRASSDRYLIANPFTAERVVDEMREGGELVFQIGSNAPSFVSLEGFADAMDLFEQRCPNPINPQRR
tara:strand:+ start:584 stop:1084 length:501 start_codon:yes stop_codon:yes gene_type:complete